MERYSSEKSVNRAEQVPTGRIIASIGSTVRFELELRKIAEHLEANNVNFYAKLETLDGLGYLHGGRERTYVMSSVDARSKMSEGYANCTGLAVVGFNPALGKNVSLLTHQYPHSFLNKERERYIDHLTARLSELKEQVDPSTIDAVIFGGNFGHGRPYAERKQTREETLEFLESRREYLDDFLGKEGAERMLEDARQPVLLMGPSAATDYIGSVELVGRLVRETLGKELEAVTGPKMHLSTGSMGKVNDAVLDTQQRRLYMTRDVEMNRGHEGSFPASNIHEEHLKWKTD